MESGLSVLIAVLGLILAVPGALVSFRDWRRGHRSPDTSVSQAQVPGPPTSGADATTPGVSANAPDVSELRSPPTAHAHAVPAGRVSLPRRLLSFFIDIYVLILPAAAIDAMIDPPALRAETDENSTVGGVAFAATALMAVGYVVIMARSGRSLGKLIVGARLERADTPGKPPGIARTLLHILVALLLNWLSYLFALSREDRRTIHDLAAGTRAVRSR
jgi:uncharacterized RDD family membrane protein YckC